MLLELSDVDIPLLDQVLRLRLRAMLIEITHADDRAFRDDARRRYERLDAIREALARGLIDDAPPAPARCDACARELPVPESREASEPNYRLSSEPSERSIREFATSDLPELPRLRPIR